jgi:hypothetical protein
MSIANRVVYDSNGAHFSRKTKKEKDLTQRERSLAERAEELRRSTPKLLHRIDGKGDRQRGGVSLVCEWGQRAWPRTGSMRAACGGWMLARARSSGAKGKRKIR